MKKEIVLLCCWLPLAVSCSSEPAPSPGKGPRQSAGPVSFEPPEGWIAAPSKSSMRLAQFRLPAAEGDTEDAEMALFFFGKGQGGGVQANLDRWVGQIRQPDGRDSKDLAKVESWTQEGTKLTRIALSGDYVAETFPGSGERLDKKGFRLIAAVAELPKGAVYFKAMGPAATVARWESSIDRFLRSVRP